MRKQQLTIDAALEASENQRFSGIQELEILKHADKKYNIRQLPSHLDLDEVK